MPSVEAARPRKGFSVLIPVAHPKSGGPLLQLASTLVDPGVERSILALHLRRPVDREAYQTDLVSEQKPESEEPLRPLLSARGTPFDSVEAISFSSIDVVGGITEVAMERQASLVLMGFHHSVFSRGMLGGTVHRVLEKVETDVAIFVDRGYLGARRILVPYLGGEHDRLALQLAARAARGGQAEVVVLHVTSNSERSGKSGKTSSAKSDVDRAFAAVSGQQPITWDFRHIDDPSPVDVVLRESAQFDLVVIGVSEEWGLESQLFGLRPERIAEESPTSMLIVRKHGEAREQDDGSAGRSVARCNSCRNRACSGSAVIRFTIHSQRGVQNPLVTLREVAFVAAIRRLRGRDVRTRRDG